MMYELEKNHFDEQGFVIFRNLISANKLESYKNHYEENNHLWKRTEDERKTSGWEYSDKVHERDENVYNFLNLPEIVNIITVLLEGNKPQLHLSLIPWFSVGQSWHFDSLVAELFGMHEPGHDNMAHRAHVGAWIALDEITVDSGTFGYIPYSNKFDYANDENFLSFKNKYEEKILIKKGRSRSDDLSLLFSGQELTHEYGKMITEFAHKMLDDGIFKDEMFIASPGDVLFWSGNTQHCAHKSKPGFLRKNIIGHYHYA